MARRLHFVVHKIWKQPPKHHVHSLQRLASALAATPIAFSTAAVSTTTIAFSTATVSTTTITTATITATLAAAIGSAGCM